MPGPTRGRRTRSGEHRHDLVTAGACRVRARGPRHDAPGPPRDLESHDARLRGALLASPWSAVVPVAACTGFAGFAGFVEQVEVAALVTALDAVEAVPCGRQPPHVVLRVGQHLVALVPRQRASRDGQLLGVAQQAREHRGPSESIGLEDLDLFGSGLAVGLGFDVEVELPGRDRDGREGLSHRQPPPDADVEPAAS